MMTKSTPFTVDIKDAKIEKIMRRVQEFEWPTAPKGGGWVYGANLDYMKELCAYWLKEFDWKKAEIGLNRFPQFKTKVDGIDIHYIHEKGSGDNPRPLILTHGWPGSTFEFMQVIEPLAHPERFGGKVEDAFDVIVPSLLGYGFSGHTDAPISPRTMAKYWEKLMAENLGYESYLAQGGDWGSTITSWLGYEGAGCDAVHLNMYSWYAPGNLPISEDEKAYAAHFQMMMQAEGAYLQAQATKPLSLAYAMMDSPVGMAAWFVEKFHTWSDAKDGDIETAFTKDQILTNIMIYLVTGSFDTSLWIYNGLFTDPGGDPLPEGAKIECPTAIANMPGETVYIWPPRSMVERSMNVVQWTDFEKGGHFAALEQPELFTQDVQRFARTLQKA
jgi:microsomal epoxide hydrolase